jgi:hypothetical protein
MVVFDMSSNLPMKTVLCIQRRVINERRVINVGINLENSSNSQSHYSNHTGNFSLLAKDLKHSSQID